MRSPETDGPRDGESRKSVPATPRLLAFVRSDGARVEFAPESEAERERLIRLYTFDAAWDVEGKP